jgi:hypothetical protein
MFAAMPLFLPFMRRVRLDKPASAGATPSDVARAKAIEEGVA